MDWKISVWLLIFASLGLDLISLPGPSHCLTHWGRVTHICIGNLSIIDSDNGLLPARRQAIMWSNAEILSTGPLGANFNEMLIEIQTFSFKKMHLNMSSGKWPPFCLGLNVLNHWEPSFYAYLVTHAVIINKYDSVAYRYRKSISIIELFVSIISIYIGFLATSF